MARHADMHGKVFRTAIGVVLAAAMVLLAAPSDHAASRAVHVRTVPLCTLVAAPGNAFTAIPAPARAASRAAGAPGTASTITVTYVGFEAFPQAQAAFQAAVDIWASLVATPVPISVRAEFTALAPNVLGSAGAQYVWRDFPGATKPGTYYVDALADRLRGADAYPGQFDIMASFNSTFSSWYFGTDGATPAGTYDFVSVVLHELGHGLGFLGAASVTDGSGLVGLGGYPLAFDGFTAAQDGTLLMGFPNPSTTLGTQLTSAFNPSDPRGPGVYWSGPSGTSANGGLMPRLYTPAVWSPGSSYSHLDESTYPAGDPNSLMTPALSGAESIHDPGPVTLGIFTDLGWTPLPAVVPADSGRDFNGDGLSDLLFQNEAGQVYGWFMNGTAMTGGAWLTPDPADGALRVVATGDFTGDGKPDIVFQHSQTGAVIIDRMDGLTRLGEQALPIGANSPWKIVAAADFNADQFTDLAWQNVSTGQIYVWFMKPSGGNAGFAGADGAFLGDYVHAADQSIVTMPSATARVAGAADIDHDSHPDLIWQDDASGAVDVWFLNGTLRASAAALAVVNPVWKLRTVGDYNGDTNADLIYQHATGGDLYAWFLNGSSLVTSTYLSPAAVNPVWQLVGPR